MDRRRLLATAGAAGAALVAGAVLDACSSASSRTTEPEDIVSATGTGPAPPPEPRSAAAAVEQALLTEVERALVAYPDLAATLTPVRDAHSAHVVALVGGTPPVAAATSTAGVSSATAASSGANATAATTLRGLAARERTAAHQHATAAADTAVAGADARLIASLAAYAAAQGTLLAEVAR